MRMAVVESSYCALHSRLKCVPKLETRVVMRRMLARTPAKHK